MVEPGLPLKAPKGGQAGESAAFWGGPVLRLDVILGVFQKSIPVESNSVGPIRKTQIWSKLSWPIGKPKNNQKQFWPIGKPKNN